MFRIVTLAASVIVSLAVFVFAQDTPPKRAGEAKKADEVSRSAMARKALAERIEIPKEFRVRIPLRAVQKYLITSLAGRNQSLELMIDQSSFKEEAGDSSDMADESVVFPDDLKSLSVQDILLFAINQISNGNATFVIVNGRVDIMTREAASIRRRLNHGIAIEFRDVPLKAAIEELSERTGVTIMIDPRCAAMNKSVTLQSQNDTSLRGILSSWADIYDLKMLVDEHRVLIMPRADYMKKLRDQVEEAKMLDELGIDRTVEPRDRGRAAQP